MQGVLAEETWEMNLLPAETWGPSIQRIYDQPTPAHVILEPFIRKAFIKASCDIAAVKSRSSNSTLRCSDRHRPNLLEQLTHNAPKHKSYTTRPTSCTAGYEKKGPFNARSDVGAHSQVAGPTGTLSHAMNLF